MRISDWSSDVCSSDLQPYPGEDPTIAAGLLRIILTEGWEDKAFCARYVSDLDALRSAVEPFTPDYVADRAGIDAGELRRAASLFAKESRRAGAVAGPEIGRASCREQVGPG